MAVPAHDHICVAVIVNIYLERRVGMMYIDLLSTISISYLVIHLWRYLHFQSDTTPQTEYIYIYIIKPL